MKKKLTFVMTIVMVLALLSSSVAFATGKPPEADADALAWANITNIDVNLVGLKEEGKTNTAIFTVTFDSGAYADADAQSKWAMKTYAWANTNAYADGLAWGSITDPSGAQIYYFNTGIDANTDHDWDFEKDWWSPSDASASSYATYTETWTFVVPVYLNMTGQWEIYMGADTLASAFASAGYKMCWFGCCYGDADWDQAWDYFLAEIVKYFMVREAPQLPSLKLWAHADGVAMEYYRVTNLIDPWNIKSLSQGPIEYVVPYDASLAGNGWWTHTQRGVYFLQPWNPTDGHSAKLFGIVAYLSKATGVEVHLWADGDFVWTNGAIIFAPSSVAESIQGRYETLGRNPGEEELGNVLMALLYLPKEAYPTYLASIE